jgi:3'-5' exoribonuclease
MSEKADTMSKTQFIKDMKVKDQVDTQFLVKYIALNEAKDGKYYLNLVLKDATGDLESRIWNDAEDIYESIPKGSYVTAKGKVNFYQGRKQFVVSQISKIDESQVQLDDFTTKSDFDPELMFQQLQDIVNKLDDVYIKELLTLVLSDTEIARRLKTWQAGKSIHHAYLSGLLEHILSCTQLAISLSAHYKVNKNYVVAGAILHDLCKIYELSDGVNVDYTEEGKLVGHLVKSLEIIDRFSYKVKNFPYEMKLHLKHIMLAHHGHYEFGSPKEPMTSEAYLLHLIDLMDSKMHSIETVKKIDTTPGHWSGYVKHLDRMIYKKDLPHYTSPIDPSPNKKKPANKELKQNMGKMLEGFKVTD